MIDLILSRILASQVFVFIVVAGLLLLAANLGYASGSRKRGPLDEIREGEVIPVQGAILGMLALLLGFAFAMSEERYQVRRDLVLQEANDINTTYLRAELLPKQQENNVRVLLRRYVDVRLGFFSAGSDAAKIDAMSTPSANNTRCTSTVPLSTEASLLPESRNVPEASQLMPVG